MPAPGTINSPTRYVPHRHLVILVGLSRRIREGRTLEPHERTGFLKKRMSDALGRKIVLSRNVTYDDLRDLIITDYTTTGVTASAI
jgi:hypothetical protein